MINIIVWILFGGLVGWVASKIMNTDAEQGGVANVVIGILGSLIGGFIAEKLWGTGITGFNIGSFLVSLAGASLLIFLVKLFGRGSRV